MSSINARLASWSTKYLDKPTKTALRTAVKEHPDALEFQCIGEPRDGTYLTLREAHENGITTIEVRQPDMTLMGVIEIHPSGQQVMVR